MSLAGLLMGAIGAAWLTWMLVKLLTGVFDPPPTRPAVPWSYLATVTVVATAAVTAAGLATLRALRHPAIETLRDL